MHSFRAFGVVSGHIPSVVSESSPKTFLPSRRKGLSLHKYSESSELSSESSLPSFGEISGQMPSEASENYSETFLPFFRRGLLMYTFRRFGNISGEILVPIVWKAFWTCAFEISERFLGTLLLPCCRKCVQTDSFRGFGNHSGDILSVFSEGSSSILSTLFGNVDIDNGDISMTFEVSLETLSFFGFSKICLHR
jgi:hypothetical protein